MAPRVVYMRANHSHKIACIGRIGVSIYWNFVAELGERLLEGNGVFGIDEARVGRPAMARCAVLSQYPGGNALELAVFQKQGVIELRDSLGDSGDGYVHACSQCKRSAKLRQVARAVAKDEKGDERLWDENAFFSQSHHVAEKKHSLPLVFDPVGFDGAELGVSWYLWALCLFQEFL